MLRGSSPFSTLSNVKNGCPWQTKCPQSKTAEVCVCWFFLQSRIAEILIIAFLSWPIHFYETTGVFDSSIHIALPPESSVLLLSSPGTMIILRQRCKKKHVGSVPYERTMQQGILLVWTPLTENVVAFLFSLGQRWWRRGWVFDCGSCRVFCFLIIPLWSIRLELFCLSISISFSVSLSVLEPDKNSCPESPKKTSYGTKTLWCLIFLSFL